MVIGKVLSQRALITPDREAMIADDRTLTFDQLNKRTNRLANTLLGLGVNPGDRIGNLMFNCTEFIETYFAAAKIGAVLVPLNIRLAPPELDYILNDCEVSFFIFGHAFEEKVTEMAYPNRVRYRVSTGSSSVADTLNYEDLIQEASEEEPHVKVGENDLHVIMYTSGTTGHPKGAMLTHAAMYSAGLDMQIGLHYQYPDRCLLLVPFFHSGAITPFLGHVIRGICTVIMETFDLPAAFRIIEEKRIKHMIISGGENIYPAEVEKVIQEIPGAGEVSVIGRPDEKWGEVPIAFIEKSSVPPPSAEEIIQHCRSKLAGYKVPKEIEFIEELPRTPSGKVLKRDLRTRIR